jgi:ERCC4-type nuclease
MRNECKFLVVLLHGKIFYDRSDNVKMYKSNRRWTRKGIRNLLRTLRYAEGCFIEEAHTDEELVTTVDELQQYFDRKQHISIHVRPGLNSNWFVHAKQEQLLYFYSGLPGISLTRAKKLVERYPRPIDLYGATVEQLCEIPKFGKITATKIKSFLETGET